MMIRCRVSSVNCGTPFSFRLGMLSIYSICFSTILWQRVKKGNGTPTPTLCDNDSRPNSALAHAISRNPHQKRRKLLTSDDFPPPHAPATLTLWRTARNVREYPVKVPEMGKRSVCYHSLRKRRAHIKERRSRTIHAETAASSDPYSHRHARTTLWHPRSSGRHAAGAHRSDPVAHRRLRRGRRSMPGVRAQDGE